MSVKYFKCFIMQETKNMKLNAVEYALLMWILNWCLMYDNCNLTYKEIEERLPFIINRCQFDRAINTLAELVKKSFMNYMIFLNSIRHL